MKWHLRSELPPVGEDVVRLQKENGWKNDLIIGKRYGIMAIKFQVPKYQRVMNW